MPTWDVRFPSAEDRRNACRNHLGALMPWCLSKKWRPVQGGLRAGRRRKCGASALTTVVAAHIPLMAHSVQGLVLGLSHEPFQSSQQP